MSTYEFRCPRCNTRQTINCSYKDVADRVPECCGAPTNRVYSCRLSQEAVPTRSLGHFRQGVLDSLGPDGKEALGTDFTIKQAENHLKDKGLAFVSTTDSKYARK
jgi:hypothetical protein